MSKRGARKMTPSSGPKLRYNFYVICSTIHFCCFQGSLLQFNSQSKSVRASPLLTFKRCDRCVSCHHFPKVEFCRIVKLQLFLKNHSRMLFRNKTKTMEHIYHLGLSIPSLQQLQLSKESFGLSRKIEAKTKKRREVTYSNCISNQNGRYHEKDQIQ